MSIILNTIAKYDLNEREAAAFKCGAIYVHLLRKMFPKMMVTDIIKGDPRKKELFKYCWKMLNEIEGKITPEDYKSFIFAQIAIFKNNMDDDIPVYIHPNCLVGEKAWNRWLVFKKAHDKKRNLTEAKLVTNLPEVTNQLNNTKTFVDLVIKQSNDIIKALENGSMQRWIKNKQISPYYVWLSPTVKNWIDYKKTTVIDFFGLEVRPFQSGVNEESVKLFQELFPSG